MCSTVEDALHGVLGGVGGRDEEILTLVELIDRANAALVERVGVFDAAEEYKADGAFSFACWLRARADVSRAESLQLERFARRLRTMPGTEAAVAQGKLSVTKARLLAGVINERTTDRFSEQEAFRGGRPLSICAFPGVRAGLERRGEGGVDPFPATTPPPPQAPTIGPAVGIRNAHGATSGTALRPWPALLGHGASSDESEPISATIPPPSGQTQLATSPLASIARGCP